MLFRNASGILLRHDATTNPAAAGVLMSECCCHDDDTYARCQWAVDWQFFCAGACSPDGEWEDGRLGPCLESRGAGYVWKPKTTYGVGSKVAVNDGFWICIAAHVSRDTWDGTEQAFWYNGSIWLVVGGPRCVNYAPGAAAVQPGLYYTAANHCGATRFGPIHVGTCAGTGACPSLPDVPMGAPADYGYADLCGPDWYRDVGLCGICRCSPPLPCRLVLTISGLSGMMYDRWGNPVRPLPTSFEFANGSRYLGWQHSGNTLRIDGASLPSGYIWQDASQPRKFICYGYPIHDHGPQPFRMYIDYYWGDGSTSQPSEDKGIVEFNFPSDDICQPVRTSGGGAQYFIWENAGQYYVIPGAVATVTLP